MLNEIKHITCQLATVAANVLLIRFIYWIWGPLVTSYCSQWDGLGTSFKLKPRFPIHSKPTPTKTALCRKKYSFILCRSLANKHDVDVRHWPIIASVGLTGCLSLPSLPLQMLCWDHGWATVHMDVPLKVWEIAQVTDYMPNAAAIACLLPLPSASGPLLSLSACQHLCLHRTSDIVWRNADHQTTTSSPAAMTDGDHVLGMCVLTSRLQTNG